jgi:hypothetical protein
MVLERVWQLRTDPFYPEVGRDGSAIQKNAVERSLDPHVDPNVLAFYFDVYDWTSSHLVGGLSEQHALAKFPEPRMLPSDAPLTILISGARQTGLDSLANLIVHKIEKSVPQDCLVCEVELESRDKAKNVLAVARSIMDAIEYANPPFVESPHVVPRMSAKYEQVRKEQEGQKDGAYSELFRAFGRIMAPLHRALIIKIASGGDNDSWVRIQEAVKSCCSYVLVLTPDLAYAKTCYDAMITLRQNIAWIQALPLDEQKAREYVVKRLSAVRIHDRAQNSLLPFTESAITALYEPGTAAQKGQPLKHPIGWLRRTLHQAIRDQVEQITVSYPDEQSLQRIDPAHTYIREDVVKRARDTLNKGGK